MNQRSQYLNQLLPQDQYEQLGNYHDRFAGDLPDSLLPTPFQEKHGHDERSMLESGYQGTSSGGSAIYHNYKHNTTTLRDEKPRSPLNAVSSSAMCDF